MRNIFTVLVLVLGSFSFGQEVYQLDSISWTFQKPDGFEYKDSGQDGFSAGYELFAIERNDDLYFGSMEVTYSGDNNLKSLTPEVYVYVLQDGFEKAFNNEKFKAQVNVAKQYIDGRNFYLIRSFVTEIESEMNFYMDYYFTDVSDREFGITIIYNNDVDKAVLEQSFFNSKFR